MDQGTKSLRDSPLRRTAHLRAPWAWIERSAIPRQRPGGYIIVKNLNDKARAIGDAVITCRDHLDEQLETVSVGQGRGLQKIGSPMMLQGCREAHRVEVVERDIFATPNSLKSQEGQMVLSPFSNIRAVTSKLWTHSRPTAVQNQRTSKQPPALNFL